MTDRTNDSRGSATADPHDQALPGDVVDHAPRSARSSDEPVDSREGVLGGETRPAAARSTPVVGAPDEGDEPQLGASGDSGVTDGGVRASTAPRDAIDGHDADGHDGSRHDGPRAVADSDTDERSTNGRDASAVAGPDQVPARTHVNGRESGLPATAAASRRDVSYAVGPFSVREVALLGVWALAFFVSFFPDNNVAGGARLLVGGTNVWLSGLWWIPAVAVPTVAVGLIVLRRLSPQGIRRVGSLGIDQFASVAFSIAALIWVAWVWDTVAIAAETGGWVRSWVVWVEAVLMIAGVALTVAAPFIPPFSADFAGRDEIPAHRLARPIRPVVPRPRTPRPATPRGARRSAAAGTATASHDSSTTPGSYTGSTDFSHGSAAAPATSVLPTHGAGADDAHGRSASEHDAAPSGAGSHDRASLEADRPHEDHHESDERAFPGDDHPTDVISSTRSDHVSSHQADSSPRAATQAFWALAPEERDVVDDYGTPIFRIGPTAWALVIEDRGETFVVRHDDGRIGYLHETSGVTRG